MSKSRIVSVAIAMSLLVGASSCRKIEEKMAERTVEKATGGGKAEVDSKTGQVKLSQKGADGKETKVEIGQNTTVPADFPRAVPIYPGSKVIAAVSISQGEKGHMVTLSTTDPVPTVMDYYKKNLTGFKVDGELGGGDTSILTLSSSELTVSVSATRSSGENETTVQLTASKNGPS
jgi:hypothetical protein